MGIQIPSWEVAAVLGTGAVVATALATTLTGKFTCGKTVEKPIPRKWIKVGSVAELTIFPIKSCKGVSVPEGIVTNLGLKSTESELLRDRVFMVVNAQGLFQVQSGFPKLATIEFSVENSKITLKAPGMADFTFELPEISEEKETKCQIFLEENLKALDCGDAVATWISTFLESDGLRLVYHHATKSIRQLSEFQKKFPLTAPEDVATFQNYTSYMLVAQESVDELNTHLKKKVTFQNFRPSILVSGTTEPFAEIRWGFVKIGENVIFKASKPCERCAIVTVDQSSGIKDPTGDPLKTLTNKLKPNFEDDEVKALLKNRGIMGLQMGLHKSTPPNLKIKIGDPVYVALL